MAAVAISAATRITRKRVASAMSTVAPVTSSTNTRGKRSAAAASATKPGLSVKRKTPKDDTPKKKESPSAVSSTRLVPTTTSVAVSPTALIPQPSAEPYVKATPWTSLSIPRSELDLSTTLKCGQSFRWHREHVELPSGEISLPIYSCVLDHRLWCIQETEEGFKYRTFRPTAEAPPQKGWQVPPPTLVSPYFVETENSGNQDSESGSATSGTADESKDLRRALEEDRLFLEDYLQLHVPLTELYEKWSETDQNFKAKAPFFPGVRILRQDPVENLVCFICSSNNNIARISQMATKLCQEYGTPINVSASALSSIDNDLPATTPESATRTFFGFPTLEALAQEGVEEKLRGLGFGYRAKYIARTAQMIQSMENGLDWLFNLRQLPYQEAHDALLTLQGVGPKVADCVCLMSLDKQDVIPVDTHVWQIAVRDYKFRFEGKVPKTISLPVYKAVSRHFFERFGKFSGWAHTVLFAADLRAIEGRVISGSDITVKVKLEDEERSIITEVVRTEIVQVKEEQEQDSQALDSPAEALSSHRRQSKRIKT